MFQKNLTCEALIQPVKHKHFNVSVVSVSDTNTSPTRIRYSVAVADLKRLKSCYGVMSVLNKILKSRVGHLIATCCLNKYENKDLFNISKYHISRIQIPYKLVARH